MMILVIVVFEKMELIEGHLGKEQQQKKNISTKFHKPKDNENFQMTLVILFFTN